MAKTEIHVTYAPDSKSTFTDLQNHLTLVESVLDATISAPSEVRVDMDIDSDGNQAIITTWDV